ncbi:MAG TPA: hypothetical protein VEB86_19485 [Chryseosolibacter sp.]|nr:hypothetical protein [Chryseosolibacter sp.]
MNKNFKAHERELVKIATFFKKESKKLIDEGKLSSDHSSVSVAVDRFVDQMNTHANIRASILEQRDYLNKLVKDDASCRTCKSKDKLKLVGTEKNEKGWKSNRYKCRKCNIEFTWNRPNNPWDMIAYIEEVLTMLRGRVEDPAVDQEEKDQLARGIQSMEGNLSHLKPVIDAHNAEYQALQQREEEMERLIHEFKNSLLIEKIKMDTWENRK